MTTNTAAMPPNQRKPSFMSSLRDGASALMSGLTPHLLRQNATICCDDTRLDRAVARDNFGADSATMLARKFEATHRARVMTYNVHGFVGTDGAFNPERVARVIEQGEPDLAALQEVELGSDGDAQAATLDWLGQRLGMQGHFTLTRPGLRGGRFGNAVLSRHAFDVVSEGSLPRRGGEHRAVQWLKVRAASGEFHLMNTHLGIWFWERHAQVRALLGAEWLVRAGSALPVVVCGDFNATSVSPVYRALTRGLRDVRGGGNRTGTWPSARPLLRIDHMFVSSEFRVLSCGVTQTAESRVASDHLPLVAELDWGGP
jgi:endonuclease/exonuclease/phosphatase family metal-dependent hydrolase